MLTTQHLLLARVGTTSPAAVVNQSVQFACRLKVTEFVCKIHLLTIVLDARSMVFGQVSISCGFCTNDRSVNAN
jgi:hypothetical protein